MTTAMELAVGCDGGMKYIYDEALNVRKLRKWQTTRASHVEPDAEGYWWPMEDLLRDPGWGRSGAGRRRWGAERWWILIHTIQLSA